MQQLLREALFTFVGKSKPDVPSVRSSVRPENNHFLRVAYEGWTHVCQQWGFENPILKKLKKSGQSVYINGKCSQVWTNFWIPFLNFCKNNFLTWIASPDKKLKSRKLGIVDSGKFVHSGRLRAPAVHGVSSISVLPKWRIPETEWLWATLN